MGNGWKNLGWTGENYFLQERIKMVNLRDAIYQARVAADHAPNLSRERHSTITRALDAITKELDAREQRLGTVIDASVIADAVRITRALDVHSLHGNISQLAPVSADNPAIYQVELIGVNLAQLAITGDAASIEHFLACLGDTSAIQLGAEVAEFDLATHE